MTEASICRAKDNTISSVKVPLVFVPGVMGSRLKFKAGSSTGQCWDPDSKSWRMLHWVRIGADRARKSLDVDNEVEVMTIPWWTSESLSDDELLRGWAGASWDSYGDFFSYMGRRGKWRSLRNPLYVWGYDWRKDILKSGDDLAKYIQSGKGPLQSEDASSCIIVTHSMGGLVARAALRQHPDLEAKVLGVIHVVQPVFGATTLYRRFLTGTLTLDGGAPFAMILGNTGPKFSQIVSGLPGPIQLLPSNLYAQRCEKAGVRWLTTTRFGDAHQKTYEAFGSVYDVYTRGHRTHPPGIIRDDLPPDVSKEIQKKLIDQVKRMQIVHETLANYRLVDRTWSIYGTGKPTDTVEHFDLPPEKILVDVIPCGEVATVLPYGVNDQGNKVYIKQGHDVDMMGWDEGRSRPKTGEGTVPDLSASGLFPGEKHDLHGTFTTADLTKKHQFVSCDIEHEPACKDPYVANRILELVDAIVGSRECEK